MNHKEKAARFKQAAFSYVSFLHLDVHYERLIMRS